MFMKQKRSIAWLMLIAGTMLLLFSGCGVSRHHPEPVRYYTLYYSPPEPLNSRESAGEYPVFIHVKKLYALPPFNTTHIVYADSPFQRSRYFYHQWVTTPADMLTSLIVRDIEASGVADMTVTMPSGKTVTHRVEGTVIDFYENDAPHQWEAVIALRLTLTRMDPASRTGEILLQKTYRETKPLEKNNPHELARSMSMAMGAVSRQFIQDIVEVLP